MALDMYSLCPCGSGKKLRFCCQAIADEMIRVERLIANEQPRPALQVLEKVAKSHPTNSWVATRRAICLLNDQRPDEARLVLLGYLKVYPDHPESNALHAFCLLSQGDFLDAKKAVHRAFRRSIGAVPEMVAELALAAAEWHTGEGHHLAARQYLSMAISLSRDESRGELMKRLNEEDFAGDIPAILRGAHPLPAYDPSPAAAEDAGRAARLSGVGCWEEAADLFQHVVEVDGQRPEPWVILGIYRAWDGNHAAAAAAFHRAAELYGEAQLERAVEFEAKAQFLSQDLPEVGLPRESMRWSISSPARVLTALDASPQLLRMPNENELGIVAGNYLLFDRPNPTDAPGLTVADLTVTLGRVFVGISSKDASIPPFLSLVCLSSRMDQAIEFVNGLIQDQFVEPERAGTRAPLDVVSFEQSLFNSDGALPFECTPERALYWREQIFAEARTKWRNSARPALAGKTPVQAADDPALRVPLLATAEIWLEAAPLQAQRGDWTELNLPALPRLTVTDDMLNSQLSNWDYRRIDVTALSDEQYVALFPALMGCLGPDIEAFLRNGLARETLKGPVHFSLRMQLARILLLRQRRDDALAEIVAARHEVGHDDPEAQILFALEELKLRTSNPKDPLLPALLREMWFQYGNKVKGLRENLAAYVQSAQIPAPWEGEVTSGGILLPGAAPPPSGQSLWIPS